MKMWLKSKLRSYLICNGWFKARRCDDGVTKIVWRYQISENCDIGSGIIPNVHITGGLPERIWGYVRYQFMAKLLVWWYKIPRAAICPKLFILEPGEKLKEIYPYLTKSFQDPDPNRNRSWICDKDGFRFTS